MQPFGLTMFPSDTKIIIVDDSSLARQNIKTVLLAMDFHNIHEAPDGDTGLQKVEQASDEGNPYGLVLLDITMPGMDGLEVAAKLRAQERFAELPIIFISARGQQNQVEEGLSSGGNRYITKPFSRSELQINLEKLWQKFH